MDASAPQIHRLLYLYAERLDSGDLDGVAALFRHGRIHGTEQPPPEAIFEGEAAVRQLYATSIRIYKAGTPRTKHAITNVHVDIDEGAGTEESRAYYAVTQATDELPLQTIITGRYHDTFHRIAGTWWFDTRTMVVDQKGDLSHHLTFPL